MTGIFRSIRDRAGSAFLILGGRARHLGRGRAGIAAVEFALILPMLLALYFGCVVLAQGLEAGKKTQQLSRTLADLTSQRLFGQQTSGNCANYTSVPCFVDSEFNGSSSQNVFNSAAQVLYPFNASNANMTISEIVFDNVGGSGASATTCCRARVVWSIGSGPSPTLRACGTVLTTTSNGTNGAGNMPMGVYPGGTGDVLTNPPTPPAPTGNTTDYYLIVADVSFSYSPGFGFQSSNWGSGGSGYVINQTTYMTPRNGATTPIVWANGGTIPSSQAHDCAGASNNDNYGPPLSAAQPANYNVP